MNKENQKGFTLIELLAVIIILGVLMIIAIPSVTTYIQNSRKSAYIGTAKEIIGGARNLVNEGKLEMFDRTITYYIPQKCIGTENGSQSPFGEFKTAYVGVVYNGEGYSYYWVSVDSSGQGIKEVTASDKLEIDDLESNLDYLEVEQNTFKTGIGGRKVVLVLDEECENWNKETDNATINISEGDEGNVIYPEGKDKTTVEIGDIVTIGTEEFYVVKHDGNNLILIARYNLKIGNFVDTHWHITGQYSSSDSGYGIQSSESKGYEAGRAFKGTVVFYDEEYAYWDGKVGSTYPGEYCDFRDLASSAANCTYVYDSNSTIYPVVQNYKSYLISQGASIKEARLLKVQEAMELGCDPVHNNCSGYSFLTETSFWLGSALGEDMLFNIYSDGFFGCQYHATDDEFGIRPVIVI